MLRRQREREERARREFERRMNPRTKEDFDLLYHALESEYISLVVGYPGPPRGQGRDFSSHPSKSGLIIQCTCNREVLFERLFCRATFLFSLCWCQL